MYFANILSTIPVHPTTVETIAIFSSFHYVFSSIARLWYFLTFSICLSTMLSSLGTAISINKAVISFLFINTILGLIAVFLCLFEL